MNPSMTQLFLIEGGRGCAQEKSGLTGAGDRPIIAARKDAHSGSETVSTHAVTYMGMVESLPWGGMSTG